MNHVYCAETIVPSECRGWMRVGNVNSNTAGCPAGLEEITAGERTLCRKTAQRGCSSVVFPTLGISYSKVCGRVYGYGSNTVDSFVKFSILVSAG